MHGREAAPDLELAARVEHLDPRDRRRELDPVSRAPRSSTGARGKRHPPPRRSSHPSPRGRGARPRARSGRARCRCRGRARPGLPGREAVRPRPRAGPRARGSRALRSGASGPSARRRRSRLDHWRASARGASSPSEFSCAVGARPQPVTRRSPRRVHRVTPIADRVPGSPRSPFTRHTTRGDARGGFPGTRNTSSCGGSTKSGSAAARSSGVAWPQGQASPSSRLPQAPSRRGVAGAADPPLRWIKLNLSAISSEAKKEGRLNVIALPPDWANYGQIISTFSKKSGYRSRVTTRTAARRGTGGSSRSRAICALLTASSTSTRPRGRRHRGGSSRQHGTSSATTRPAIRN